MSVETNKMIVKGGGRKVIWRPLRHEFCGIFCSMFMRPSSLMRQPLMARTASVSFSLRPWPSCVPPVVPTPFHDKFRFNRPVFFCVHRQRGGVSKMKWTWF